MNYNLKLLTLSAFLILGFAQFSNAQELSFTYDAAGNQITRQWICVNCPTPPPVMTINPLVEEINKSKIWKETDSLNVKRSFSAFPNPVSETLTVSWSSTEKLYVKSIAVFALSGIKVFQAECSPQQSTASISFLSFPAAGYVLRAFYSDGKTEVLKIIKI